MDIFSSIGRSCWTQLKQQHAALSPVLQSNACCHEQQTNMRTSRAAHVGKRSQDQIWALISSTHCFSILRLEVVPASECQSESGSSHRVRPRFPHELSSRTAPKAKNSLSLRATLLPAVLTVICSRRVGWIQNRQSWYLHLLKSPGEKMKMCPVIDSL